MRKNATLPTRHRYCHWLCRIFMNHPIDGRDLRERDEGYEKKDIADRLSFFFFLSFFLLFLRLLGPNKLAFDG